MRSHILSRSNELILAEACICNIVSTVTVIKNEFLSKACYDSLIFWQWVLVMIWLEYEIEWLSWCLCFHRTLIALGVAITLLNSKSWNFSAYCNNVNLFFNITFWYMCQFRLIGGIHLFIVLIISWIAILFSIGLGTWIKISGGFG